VKIIGIPTSPRCAKISEQRLYEIVESEDVFNAIHEIGYEGKVSNSEALLLAAMWGARREHVDVELVYPGQPVPEDFDGVVFASPVYFGDRSSHLHDFIRSMDLEDKAVGIVSSGAKRNGGQETTNIYALYDCLTQGAVITGNGPPTAQYGGTGWAGNKTAIVNDDFGIKTSFGTGRQVAKLSKIIRMAEGETKPNILLLVMTPGVLNFPMSEFRNSYTEVLDLTSKNIKRCVACPVCPNGDLKKDYTCIISGDDMPEIHKFLHDADCAIFASGMSDAPIDMYQTFMERTRFVRRNHFELAERVYSSMSYTQSMTDIFPLRAMTSMLRQNMFCLPFYRNFQGSSNMSTTDYIKVIEKYANKSKEYRKISGIDFEYTAVGYEDAKRDEEAYRD
jgi:multimeric flavodoxin WrbA